MKDETITLCVAGDDREREWRVTWMGVADISGTGGGQVKTALVTEEMNDEREHLICKDPEYGWCSVATAGCRDFEPDEGYPEMTDDRLNGAF